MSTPTSIQTPMCSDVLLTQEELPAKPESGSEGSSIVESNSMTRMASDAGLLYVSLMYVIENVLSAGPPRPGAAPSSWSADDLGDRPGIAAMPATAARQAASSNLRLKDPSFA